MFPFLTLGICVMVCFVFGTMEAIYAQSDHLREQKDENLEIQREGELGGYSTDEDEDLNE